MMSCKLELTQTGPGPTCQCCVSPLVTIDSNNAIVCLIEDKNIDRRFDLPLQLQMLLLFILQLHTRWGYSTSKSCSVSSETLYLYGPVAKLTLVPLPTPDASYITLLLRLIVLNQQLGILSSRPHSKR